MTAPPADTRQARGPFGWLRVLRTLPPWRQAVYWLASVAALALVIWDIIDKDARYTNIAAVALVVIAMVALRAPNPRRGEGPPHPLTSRGARRRPRPSPSLKPFPREPTMYDPDKRRLTEATDAERDLFACMRGEYGPGWYMVAWVGGLTLPTLIVLGLISVVVAD